jgi:hypothetical protein
MYDMNWENIQIDEELSLDKNLRIRIERIPAGKYCLRLQLHSRTDVTPPIVIRPAETTSVEAALSPGILVEGHIFAPADLDPAKISVSFRRLMGSKDPVNDDGKTMVMTSIGCAVRPDGRFNLNALVPGRYRLRAFCHTDGKTVWDGTTELTLSDQPNPRPMVIDLVTDPAGKNTLRIREP